MMNKIFSYKRKMYAVFVDGIEGRRKKKASEPNYCPDICIENVELNFVPFYSRTCCVECIIVLKFSL
jgi:hypothetical protein